MMIISSFFPVSGIRPQAASGGAPLDTVATGEATPSRPISPMLPAPCTAPPASWPTEDDIRKVTATACTDVEDNARKGAAAVEFDARVKREITGLQVRQAEAEGTVEMNRPVHRKQLHGGAVEVHWNPAFNRLFRFFGQDLSQGFLRLSDASNEPDPNGPGMFGLALELYGRDGKATDLLLTGGSERTEASQARDPEAQLALFNMLNHPNRLAGLGRIAADVGVVDGIRMLLDVRKMRTELATLADLTAWSRAPFALTGADGKEYLVKLRAVPRWEAANLTTQGDTTAAKLATEMAERVSRGETRWKLEVQFMQPGDDPYDARETWSGDWVQAGEIVVPRQNDPARARRLADQADSIRYSVWKNKEPGSLAADRDVLRPWGELNRARHAAYLAAGSNRHCPFLTSATGTTPPRGE